MNLADYIHNYVNSTTSKEIAASIREYLSEEKKET